MFEEKTEGVMSQLVSAALTFPGRFMEGPADRLRAILRRFADPYRPERHYMRGPGPKWREKHSPQAAPHIGDLGLPSIWKSGT